MFLCLKISHDLLKLREPTHQDGVTLAEEASKNFPREINQIRNKNKQYDVEEVINLHNKSNILNCIRTQKFSKDLKLYSLEGLAEMKDVFKNKGAYIFTSPPCSIPVWHAEDQVWLVDTHCIAENLGGNGNGILKVFNDIKTCTY